MRTNPLSPKLSTAYDVRQVETVEELKAALLQYSTQSTELTPVKIVLKAGVVYRLSEPLQLNDSVRPIHIVGEQGTNNYPIITGHVEAQNIPINPELYDSSVRYLLAVPPNGYSNSNNFGFQVKQNGIPIDVLTKDFGTHVVTAEAGNQFPSTVVSGIALTISSDNTNHYVRARIKNDLTNEQGQYLKDYIEDYSVLYVFTKWLCYRLEVSALDEVAGDIFFTTTLPQIDATDTSRILVDISQLFGVQECRIQLVNYHDYNVQEAYAFYNGATHLYQICGGPLPGETDNTLPVFTIPTLSTLIQFKRCTNVKIEHILFEGTAVDNIVRGWTHQAENNSFAAIDLHGCQNIRISACQFVSIMGYCICARKYEGTQITGSKRVCLCDNKVIDTFGGGFWLGDDTWDNEITNNLIQGFGKYLPGSVGILIQRSIGNNVTHNTIKDGYYSGICVGWTWGYFEPQAYDNYIAYNHISHLMKRWLNDGGGIYTMGDSPGTIIEHNLVHDIYSLKPKDAAGIYLDEGSSHIVVRNNVIYNCSMGVHQHYGASNEIYNCIFANLEDGAIKLSVAEKHMQCYVHNNLFQLKKRESYTPLLVCVHGNIYLTNNLCDIDHTKDIVEAKSTGRIKNLHVGDFSFTGSESGVFTYRNRSHIDNFYIGGQNSNTLVRQDKRDFYSLNKVEYGYKQQ